jgi:hypothetical protein
LVVAAFVGSDLLKGLKLLNPNDDAVHSVRELTVSQISLNTLNGPGEHVFLEDYVLRLPQNLLLGQDIINVDEDFENKGIPVPSFVHGEIVSKLRSTPGGP